MPVSTRLNSGMAKVCENMYAHVGTNKRFVECKTMLFKKKKFCIEYDINHIITGINN